MGTIVIFTDLLYFGCDTVQAEGDEPVQMKLYRSLKVWSFYVDLVESLGSLEATRAIYERIVDLKIATPQMIINFALLLEVLKTYLQLHSSLSLHGSYGS